MPGVAFHGGKENIWIEFLQNMVHGQVNGIGRVFLVTVPHKQHGVPRLSPGGNILLAWLWPPVPYLHAKIAEAMQLESVKTTGHLSEKTGILV